MFARLPCVRLPGEPTIERRPMRAEWRIEIGFDASVEHSTPDRIGRARDLFRSVVGRHSVSENKLATEAGFPLFERHSVEPGALNRKQTMPPRTRRGMTAKTTGF